MTTFMRRLLMPLSLLAALALAAPAAAPAAGKHRHGHKARKHKRRRTRTKVVCSSTLVCPSHSGANGAPGVNGLAGTPGANGTAGANGANGASMATRARSAGAVTTVNCGGSCPDQNDPLNNNTWTQAANEADHLVGTLTFTAPNSCSGSGFFNLLLDGTVIESDSFSSGGGTQTIQFTFNNNTLNNGDLPETGSATTHTLTEKVGDTCTTGGDGHFTVNSVSVDVERFT